LIEWKRFTDTAPDQLPAETVYHNCNFARRNPDTSGATPVGVRLWPGDDTPRRFVDCNLQNCEVPPGSEVIRSPRAIIESDVVLDTNVIVVDGVERTRRDRMGKRFHGYYDPDTNAVVREPTPIEEVEE
jgi:hypothetical protein